MQVCPGCGEGSPDRFTECPFCGHALSEPHETHEERKVLTVVFCDLKDSTALGERLDPESLGEVLDLYFTGMTRVLKRHGGSIQKFIGDAIVAAFGIPVVHEDDALRAVRAASEMLDALERLNRQLGTAYGVTLEVRIGVHTGEVVIRSASNDQQLLTGDTLNTAARLEQAAASREILLGEPTQRLVRDAVVVEAVEPLELKGKSERVPAYRLVRVFGDEQSSRRHDAPLVGREAEQHGLLDTYADAVAERRCHLATVIGEAGVGKSRLVRALIEATSGEATALRGRCLPYGEGITFWPIRAIVGEACEIDADDPAEIAREKVAALSGNDEVTRRVASTLGWSAEHLPMPELFWGIRELLQHLARDRPLVLVIDDIHWAAPTLLELIEHLVETIEDAPMLVLATARPDMLESRPTWSEGPRQSRLVLERLPDGAAAAVIDHLLDGVPMADAARTVVIGAAEGNPLFVEQLVSMLIDSGMLVERGGVWDAARPLDRISIPPSIQALLGARLDLLTSSERAVIEPASVIGLEFPSSAVQELVPSTAPESVGEHLAELIRKQLIRPSSSEGAWLDDHRFHHILVRDATYHRTLKRARADLHERFAGWLEHFDADHGRLGENDEIVGYHLEQAWHYRRELHASDGAVEQLGLRAAAKLGAAGLRAFMRGDLPATAMLLGRAADVLPPLHPVRLSLLPDLAEARMETGDFEGAIAILAEADEPEARMANEPEVARAHLIRLLVDLYAGPDAAWADRVRQQLDVSVPIFEATDHQVGLATAWRVRYWLYGSALRFDESAEAARHVAEHAVQAGDVRQQRRAAVAYAQSALHGSTPVVEAIQRCGELLAGVEGDRQSQALIKLSLAHLLAMDLQGDRARTEYAEAQHMLQDLGHSVMSSSTSVDAAAVELLAGDLDAAERELRRDYDELGKLNETYLRSSVAGMLARVLALRGASDEATEVAQQAQHLAATDDVDAQALWRSALGHVHASAGRFDEGINLVTEALAMTPETNDPLLRAQLLTDRATILAAAGRIEEALVDRREASTIYQTKGNRAGAASLSRLGNDPPADAPVRPP